MKKTAISGALALAMGFGLAGQAHAVHLGAGSYQMLISETPEFLPGTGLPDVGCVGSVCIHSSFTFGGFPSLTTSNRMTDNAVTVAGAGGIGGDGVAGIINFDLDAAGNMTFTSFSVDAIAGTAAGTFAQYVPNPAGISGFVDSAGNMTITPTGRLANTSGPVITGNPWNMTDYDDNGTPLDPTDDIPGTTWAGFTTGTANGLDGDITGQAVDAFDHAVLVSATAVGDNWGTFAGGTYYEVWSVDIRPTVIPVPAAVWLFGSGLLGLVGVARRKKA